MPEAPAPSTLRTPATLRWAVGLLAIQAVALAGVVVFLVYEDIAAASVAVQSAVATIVFTAFLAVLLGVLAWSLWHRRAWARGPAIVLQMLLVPIGYYMTGGGLPALGVPVIAVGLVGAGALLAPATRAALQRR